MRLMLRRITEKTHWISACFCWCVWLSLGQFANYIIISHCVFCKVLPARSISDFFTDANIAPHLHRWATPSFNFPLCVCSRVQMWICFESFASAVALHNAVCIIVSAPEEKGIYAIAVALRVFYRSVGIFSLDVWLLRYRERASCKSARYANSSNTLLSSQHGQAIKFSGFFPFRSLALPQIHSSGLPDGLITRIGALENFIVPTDFQRFFMALQRAVCI